MVSYQYLDKQAFSVTEPLSTCPYIMDVSFDVMYIWMEPYSSYPVASLSPDGEFEESQSAASEPSIQVMDKVPQHLEKPLYD
jgi:hypothetical protein